MGNYANYGGAIAAQGSLALNVQNVRALGNEANASGSCQCRVCPPEFRSD